MRRVAAQRPSSENTSAISHMAIAIAEVHNAKVR